MSDAAKIDRSIRLLCNEAGRLRELRQNWAAAKAIEFDQAAELLRQFRQEKQMSGMNKRIDQ